MPYFSVIIPTYNRYQLTKRAINSVLKQTYNDYELIIINDGSTDKSQQLEADYKEKIKFITIHNSGVSAARNCGIKKAQGNYIALLDSDDEWLPDKLTQHKLYIDTHPHICIHQSDEMWIRNGKRVNPMHKHRKRAGDIFHDSLERCLISPSSVVIERSLFNTYGLFDENLPACEDYDLWLRMCPFENIGLLKKQLNIRYAGHPDQLSSLYWGMDRFRVYAILKLLDTNGPSLNKDQREAAIKMAKNKIAILYNGAVKRNNSNLQKTLSIIQKQLNQKSYNNINYQSLLAE